MKHRLLLCACICALLLTGCGGDGSSAAETKEEIQEEAAIRQLASFSRFLDIAAQCSGEMVNYTNIAQDCGVSATTIKEYFNILEQTLIGYMIPAFTLSK